MDALATCNLFFFFEGTYFARKQNEFQTIGMITTYKRLEFISWEVVAISNFIIT